MRRAWVLVCVTAVLVVLPARAEELFAYRVCSHVPITGAAAIPHHESRFGQFYFDYVNAELGGIDGHPVTMRSFDDRYFPAGARDALERCAREGAHLYVGQFGTDQIVTGARWADENAVPYMHGSAASASFDGLGWTAMLGPGDEEQMAGLANVMSESAQADPVFGTVYIDSPYFEPGRAAFRDAVVALGYDAPVEIPVQKDEREFSNVWFELQDANVTHVNLYATAWIALNMMNQRPPLYDPVLGSIEATVGSNIVASAAPPSTFVAFHDPGPVYDPDDEALPWHEEIVEFLRIFHEYSPEQDPPPDDFDWNAYLRARQLHAFLDAADEDVSPDHLRSMFSSHIETAAAAFPTCALDFGRSPRLGQHAWQVFRLEAGEWEQAAFCATAVGVDITPPTIECGDGLQVVTGRVVCAFRDPGSGISRWHIAAVDRVTGERVVRSGRPGCAPFRERRVRLPAGVHEVTVVAVNCGRLRASTALEVVSVSR